LTILLLSFVCRAQIEEVKRITQTLCSPEFHGRGYVQSGDSIAAAFIASEFEKVGLLPLGESYFQHFTFPVNRFPGEVDFKLNGAALKVGRDILVDPASPSFYGSLKVKTIRGRDVLNEERLFAKIQEIIAGKEFNCVALDFSGIPADTLKMISGFRYELAQFMPVIQLTDSKFTWSVAREQLAFPIFELQQEVYSD